MKKLWQIIVAIITQFIPIISVLINKKVKRRAEKEIDYVKQNKIDLKRIKLDSLNTEYNETFRIKDKFEDKAKTNIVGITIAITIIVNASSVLSKIESKYNCCILNWISFGILLLSILYLLSAGWLAIKTLCGDNKMYFVSRENLLNNRQIGKKEYINCIEKNKSWNTIRNNNIYSSYLCIRNAIISILIILVLVAIPIC